MKEIVRINREKLENHEIDYDDNLVTIDRVVVKKLFNLFDYDISFKNEENVSIFIAPNGCGKTTIFKFLNFFSDISEEKFRLIKHIPYESFVCYYSNGAEVSLTTNKEDVDECDFYNKTYKIKYKDKCESVNLYNVYKDSNYNPDIEKMFCTIMNDFNCSIPNNVGISIIPELYYISANRLVLDNVNSFFSEIKNSQLNEKNIQQEMLKDFAYAFGTVSTLKQIAEDVKKMFKTIDTLSNDDKEAKQITVDMYKEKIDLLTEIFNKRNRLTRKEIVFSKEYGLQIFQNNKLIPLDCLSSGEKNDLVVFYNLIFQPMEIHNYLIDEPEISLHIQWQKEYVDYILKIAKMNNIQVIIATHSPSIINGHFDLYADKKVEVIDE